MKQHTSHGLYFAMENLCRVNLELKKEAAVTAAGAATGASAHTRLKNTDLIQGEPLSPPPPSNGSFT